MYCTRQLRLFYVQNLPTIVTVPCTIRAVNCNRIIFDTIWQLWLDHVIYLPTIASVLCKIPTKNYDRIIYDTYCRLSPYHVLYFITVEVIFFIILTWFVVLKQWFVIDIAYIVFTFRYPAVFPDTSKGFLFDIAIKVYNMCLCPHYRLTFEEISIGYIKKLYL